MNKNNPKIIFKIILLIVVIAIADTSFITSPAEAGEVMKDRCSGNVAIVPKYNDRPNTRGVIVLERGADGTTDWTPPFTVQLGRSGHIRWWCNSTRGNIFDPGTWRIEELSVGTKCKINPNGGPENCKPDVDVKLGSSAWQDWTPERSRCSNRSNRIQARLGRNRLLRIKCL